MLPIPIPTPIILDHEGAGVIEAVGTGVKELATDDHVVTAAVSHCRHCSPCLRGMPYFCNSSLELAWGGGLADGTKRFHKGGVEISHFFLQSSFAEFTVVPGQITVRVPSELPLEQLGPLACGISTGAGAVLNIGGVRPGDRVAVIGCGAVGLSAIMGARLARLSNRWWYIADTRTVSPGLLTPVRFEYTPSIRLSKCHTEIAGSGTLKYFTWRILQWS